MMLQVRARSNAGKIMGWTTNSEDYSADLEQAVGEVKSMVTEEVKKETKHMPAVVLVGIQGGKQ